MLDGGKFKAYLQNSPWIKAANTVTLLENNLITPNRNISPLQHFFKKEKRNVLTLMQKFGETFIATYKDNKHQAKLANQCTPAIWLGYAESHPINTYRFSSDFPTKVQQ